MSVLIFVNGIMSLVLAVYLIYLFFKKYEKEEVNRVINWISLINFGFVLMFVLSFLWFFEFAEFEVFSYGVLYSISVVLITLVFFKSVYVLSGKNRLVSYFFFFYLITFVSFVFLNFFVGLIISSFFMILILNLVLFFGRYFKESSVIGMFYSSISLLFMLVFVLGFGNLVVFSLISNVLFWSFIYYFIVDLEGFPKSRLKEEKGDDRDKERVVFYLKYFVFIVVLSNFVFISTVAMHEFGHAALSRFYDCDSTIIFYEGDSYPHTEILCSGLEGKKAIILAGPLIPLIIALFLFLAGGKIIKSLSLLVIGFNFIASFKDVQDFGFSLSVGVMSVLIGAIFVLLGALLLAKSRMGKEFEEMS